MSVFARAGESFTAELWGAEFNGTPIEVIVNGPAARAAAEIGAENTQLRAALHAVSEELDEHQHLAALQEKRERPWVARWQQETGKHDTLPDYGAILEWIVGKAEQAEAQLAQAGARGDERARFAPRPGARFGTHCPYCAQAVGMFSEMAAADEAAKAHIQSCPKHPLAGLRDLIARLALALSQHLPPDPHGGGGSGHVCDAECEEMSHLGQLLNDAKRALLPPEAPRAGTTP